MRLNLAQISRFSMMTHDLHEIAGGMRQVSQLGLEHQEAMETQVVDVLRDYSGIIHTLPVLVKLHEEAMEMFNASKEKDSVSGCGREGGREGGRERGREGGRGREGEGGREREGGREGRGEGGSEGGGREGGRLPFAAPFMK